VNGGPAILGVVGAVAIPACRRIGFSASLLIGGKEDINSGDGCVDDLWAGTIIN
jgi:hypothetical protein